MGWGWYDHEDQELDYRKKAALGCVSFNNKNAESCNKSLFCDTDCMFYNKKGSKQKEITR